MSNAAEGFDESVETEQNKEGDGLYQAQPDDLSSKKSLEAQQGYPSCERALDEGHVEGVHRAQHNHVNTERVAQHGESRVEKVTEEGFDDGLHRAQHGDFSSEKEMQGSYGGGPHRAQQCDLSCEQKVEESLGHEYASLIALKLPQSEEATNAQNPHNSFVGANLIDIGTSSEHGDVGAQANLAACRTCDKHQAENVPFAQDSEGDADQNIGTQGRPIEYSCAAYRVSFGTLGEHTQKNGFANGTVGEHAHDDTSACATSEHHAGGNIAANVDFYTAEGGHSGNYPHKNMFGNCSVGEYDNSFNHGDSWSNVYDHMSRGNDSDANAHEKTSACDETGGEGVIIDLSQDANKMQASTVMKSLIKSSSPIPGSLYYKTQSGAMKNVGLAFRFGSAIFSLIAFSIIISTNEKRVAAGSTFYVKFSDFQAYNYLVALSLFSCLYSSGQLMLLAQARSNILSSPVKWGVLVYLCDQMLAFLMVSSSSSAATASELSRHGLHNIWPPACSTWNLSFFCSKADVAMAMSFVSFLFMLLSSLFSGYHLSNLLSE